MILFDTREKIPVALFITIMIFIRHRENIARLITGTETRVGEQK
jgi:glycerol-3-phosphate acyltransferase PlsY